MENWNIPRALVASLVAGGALVAAGSVMAQAVPVTVTYGQAHLVPVGLQVVVVGWQPDGRYWDGHHYYSHDDWMHRHPHDPGPRHLPPPHHMPPPHHRDDHRPPPHP